VCNQRSADDKFSVIFSGHIAVSTAYVDVAYCYRPSSVVCRSVCRSVTLVSPAKTAALIEMLFGLRIRVGHGNHVLDGGSDPPWEGAVLREKRGVPL